jgi:succinate dehydrogenase / fumarate reductase cytochrome b subunit
VATTTKPYSSSPVAPAAPRSLTLAGARRSYFNSSVGTKVLIGITGLLLFLYLLLHVAGNVLVFFGPETFNGYSYFLIHNPLIVPVELCLAAIFLLHVYKTVTNWWANRSARPQNYYRASRRLFGWGWAGYNSRKSIASSTMIFTGLLTFLFILIHLKQFRFGPEYTVLDPSGREIRDLYRTEVENFSNVLNVVFYAICMVFVGSHIWHGFSSAFNSLGADHPRYTPWALRAGKVFAVLIAGGFLLIPIWIYAFGSRP